MYEGIRPQGQLGSDMYSNTLFVCGFAVAQCQRSGAVKRECSSPELMSWYFFHVGGNIFMQAPSGGLELHPNCTL